MLIHKTSVEFLKDIARRAKARRLDLSLTQAGLAERSGVSLGSVKRFEKNGEISLHSLLKCALVLERLDDFDQLFKKRDEITSIDELLKKKTERKRGTKH